MFIGGILIWLLFRVSLPLSDYYGATFYPVVTLDKMSLMLTCFRGINGMVCADEVKCRSKSYWPTTLGREPVPIYLELLLMFSSLIFILAKSAFLFMNSSRFFFLSWLVISYWLSLGRLAWMPWSFLVCIMMDCLLFKSGIDFKLSKF